MIQVYRFAIILKYIFYFIIFILLPLKQKISELKQVYVYNFIIVII